MHLLNRLGGPSPIGRGHDVRSLQTGIWGKRRLAVGLDTQSFVSGPGFLRLSPAAPSIAAFVACAKEEETTRAPEQGAVATTTGWARYISI